MSERPRTMTAANEEYYRCHGPIAVFKELDAERAAHDSSEQTIRELRDQLAQVEWYPGIAVDFQRERGLSDQLAAALGELRCWIGQNVSAEQAGAKCDTRWEATEQADSALSAHAVMRSEAALATPARNSETDSA